MGKPIALVVTSLLLAAGAARGQDAQAQQQSELAARYDGQGWSVLSGQTVGDGSHVLYAQAGFPGLTLGYLHGLLAPVDLGFELSLNYGYEGLVTAIVPGVKGEFEARIGLLTTSSVSLGLNLGVGVFGYFGPAYSVTGVSLPVGLALGVPIGSAMVVHVTLDSPIFAVFGPLGGFTFPLMLGGGVEYFIDRRLAATFTTRMGPALYPKGFRYDSRADFDLQVLLGVSYKL